MARIINGRTHYTSSEMAQLKGGTRSAWSHFARTGKIPAIKWIDDNWYFDPDKIDALAVENKYAGQLNNVQQQG